MDPKEIIESHILHMKSLRFKEDNVPDRFSSFHWTPDFNKSPYKHRFIGSSFDYTTNLLSVLLAQILSAVIISRTGTNEMWILKNSSELLQKLNSLYYPQVTSVQTFDFSTLYTSISYQKLEDRSHNYVCNFKHFSIRMSPAGTNTLWSM